MRPAVLSQGLVVGFGRSFGRAAGNDCTASVRLAAGGVGGVTVRDGAGLLGCCGGSGAEPESGATFDGEFDPAESRAVGPVYVPGTIE
jgi:hypothetical protein